MEQKEAEKEMNTEKKKNKTKWYVLGALLLAVVAAVFAFTRLPAASPAEAPQEEETISWEAFEAMTPEEQEAFYNSFASPEEYLAWMEAVSPADVDLPWKNGGKQPEEYTWEEFDTLTLDQKTAFQEAFASEADFLSWVEGKRPKEEVAEILMPWEDGGKQPNEYTLEEFYALTLDQQNRFVETFGSREEFERWLELAEDNVQKPWENSGKQPDQYTWEEFLELSAEQQEAFYESFESAELFEAWMDANMPQETVDVPEETIPEETYLVETVPASELPWENGGKQPSEYTLEEFDALSEELKNAFYDSFESPDAFVAWLDQASGSAS